MADLTMWTEKYRPETLDDYVWVDGTLKAKAIEWIEAQEIPGHVLFSGGPGTGKTSLAYLILKLMGVPSCDIIYINGSKETGKSNVDDKISNFISTWAMGPSGVKYVILDEMDRFSPAAQDMLKGEMEQNCKVCRFILTSNKPHKIIEPLHSRVMQFEFKAMDKDDFAVRLGEVLVSEEVDFNEQVLMDIVDSAYPDLRKAINVACQSSKVIDGKMVLTKPSAAIVEAPDYLLQVIDLFKKRRTLEARKLLVAKAAVEDYPDLFRFMYENLEVWGETEDEMDSALLIIKRGMVNHTFSSCPELNISSLIVELSMNARNK